MWINTYKWWTDRFVNYRGSHYYHFHGSLLTRLMESIPSKGTKDISPELGKINTPLFGYSVKPIQGWTNRDLSQYFRAIADVTNWVQDYVPCAILVVEGSIFISTRMITKNPTATSITSASSTTKAPSPTTVLLQMGIFTTAATTLPPQSQRQIPLLRASFLTNLSTIKQPHVSTQTPSPLFIPFAQANATPPQQSEGTGQQKNIYR